MSDYNAIKKLHEIVKAEQEDHYTETINSRELTPLSLGSLFDFRHYI